MRTMPALTPPWEIKRKLLVKAEEETDQRYGCKPAERTINDYIRFGVINLDKPAGPSSHEVTAWVKRLLSLGHAGHGGTLDPKVTGVLPVTLEEATKTVQALLVSGKEYVCVMRLHNAVSKTKVQAVLNEFQGEIYQRPPVRSSVKRRIRTRKIYRITFVEMTERDVLFHVACEAGTYIRKLCFDIGEVLGVGAHMQELRRTRAGPFTEAENMVTLHDIAYLQSKWQETQDKTYIRKFIQPMEKILDVVPKIIIRDSAVDAVCHGANLAAPGVLSLETGIQVNDTVAVMTQKGEAVALAQALVTTQDIMKLSHGLIAKTQRVLMPRGVYPKLWQKKPQPFNKH
jgi:H/ACA ribonucleoprotein complex subunit 4